MSQSALSFGGLASGMDTQSIIDKLVQLESRPLQLLQQRQAAYSAQVSLLGDLASKLGALHSTARDLASGGILANQATSSNVSFAASPGSDAAPGSYAVQVSTLATAAKWRSGPFGAGDALQQGSLTLTVGGTTYPPAPAQPIAIAYGESLDDVASAVRATGAPVSVTVLDDGQSRYLSVTNLATGYTGDPSTALQMTFVPADAAGPGTALGAAAHVAAPTNASFTVDGLAFTRTSNTVADAIPGTTLTLKSGGGPAETLTIGSDVAGTQARLQKLVDAYDTAMRAVQQQLAVTKDTDRSTTLAGDPAVRSLGAALQALTSTTVAGTGSVRSLADLGVKTQRDGTLTIDPGVLASAVARDAAGVNALLSAPGGIARLTADLSDGYTLPATGLLSLRQQGLRQELRSLDAVQAATQARIDAYHDRLVAQFTAMEDVVSQLKGIGSFLTSQDDAANRK